MPSTPGRDTRLPDQLVNEQRPDAAKQVRRIGIMAKLTLSFKEKKLKMFAVTGSELVVGRAPECAIHIDSLAIQPQHARVFADGDGYRIESLQAVDPVQVNHRAIAEATLLEDGDQIQVGKHTLSYSSEPANEGVQLNHTPSSRLTTGWLQIISGSHLGRTIRLDRAMTRLGKTGKESAIISRREDGYFIAHLEGDTPPLVNGESVASSSQRLCDGDHVHIGRLELYFYTDGSKAPVPGNGTVQAEQRRFTRIPFDAAATLLKDGREWPCELIDLSLKGALVREPDDWTGRTGEDYALRLQLDEDTGIHMAVRVAHTEEQQIGLACLDIDLDSVSHLRRLVELNLGDAALLERDLIALG